MSTSSLAKYFKQYTKGLNYDHKYFIQLEMI
jgi:hypothetical protein